MKFAKKIVIVTFATPILLIGYIYNSFNAQDLVEEENLTSFNPDKNAEQIMKYYDETIDNAQNRGERDSFITQYSNLSHKIEMHFKSKIKDYIAESHLSFAKPNEIEIGFFNYDIDLGDLKKRYDACKVYIKDDSRENNNGITLAVNNGIDFENKPNLPPRIQLHEKDLVRLGKKYKSNVRNKSDNYYREFANRLEAIVECNE